MIAFAELYDGVHPRGGPYFSARRQRVDDPAERDRILGYLRAGAILLQTTALDRDVVTPARGRRVPMGWRTDGAWVWSEGLGYYLETHGYAPDPEFYQHIRNLNHRCPEPDREAVLAALDAFYARQAEAR